MMKKYLQVAKIKLQDSLEYRFDFIFGNFSHFLPLIALLILWSAVYRGQDEMAGYSYQAMLTYFVLARAIQSMAYFSFRDEIEKEIKDGLLSKYLLRPISYLGYWFSVTVADKALNFTAVVFFFFVAAFATHKYFLFNWDPKALFFFFISLAGSLLINFYFSFAVSLAAFWMSEIWALGFTVDMVKEFLAGGVFVLELLPAWAFKPILVTPFPYTLWFPAQIYLGRLNTTQILEGFGAQAVFIVLSYFFAKWVWSLGMRKYEAVGA
jgi:ABC-2 type transport system permease protein